MYFIHKRTTIRDTLPSMTDRKACSLVLIIFLWLVWTYKNWEQRKQDVLVVSCQASLSSCQR